MQSITAFLDSLTEPKVVNVPAIPLDVRVASVDVMLGGSSVMCNPPVLDTDVDIVCLVREQDYNPEVFKALGFDLTPFTKEGYESRVDSKIDFTGKPKQYLNFFTMRRGVENIIVTCCETYFERMRIAIQLSTQLNLLAKEDRRSLFEVIKYGPEMHKHSGGVL
jgi:hypothetical protein